MSAKNDRSGEWNAKVSDAPMATVNSEISEKTSFKEPATVLTDGRPQLWQLALHGVQ
jgi:hypothetical protein